MQCKWANIMSSALPAILSLIIGSSLTFIFFPGLMSYDSVYQYQQAIFIQPVTDAHPAIMVFLWRALLSVYNNSGMLLIFHQIIYWLSITLFAFMVSDRLLVRVLTILGIGLLPPLAIHSIHLWKDVGMMSCFALAISALTCLLYTSPSPRDRS